MEQSENIMGQKLERIDFLIAQLSSTTTEVEKILFRFESHNLLLEIDYDYDQIMPRIIQDYNLERVEETHQIITASEQNFPQYADILDTKLIWLWEMTNNRGYLDGIQLEFENHITFQFLVEASYFRNSRLELLTHKVTTPKTGNRNSENYGRLCKYI